MTERPSSIHTRAGGRRAGRAMRSSPQPRQLSAGRSRSWPVRASHHSNDRPAPNSSTSTESSCCSHGDAPGTRHGPVRSPAAEQPPSRASRPRWPSPIDVFGGASQQSSREQVLCQVENGRKLRRFSESSGPGPRSREFVRATCRISRTPIAHCLHSLTLCTPRCGCCPLVHTHARERSPTRPRTRWLPNGRESLLSLRGDE